MNAAAERAELAAIGCDLVALSGDAGALRAAALLAPPVRRATRGFADLSAVPAWLRLPRDQQRGLARRTALLAMAPALSVSIDGAWLGELAERAGEREIDWAIGQAGDLPGEGLPAVRVVSLEATGFALMRAALPEALAGYVDWAENPGVNTATLSIHPELVEGVSFFAFDKDGEGFDRLSPNGDWAAYKRLATFCVTRAAEYSA